MPIPESVTFDEVRAALKPLYDLLGVSDINVYAEPGLSFAGDTITFVVPATIETVDAEGRRAAARAIRVLPDHPHPQDSRREIAEVAYVVTVKVERP